MLHQRHTPKRDLAIVVTMFVVASVVLFALFTLFLFNMARIS